MTGFTPANGALMTADQHRIARRDASHDLRDIADKIDTVERLRMMSLARDYYRDHLPAMVHTIIAAGGNLIDIAWLTQDSVDRVRAAWIDWARMQIDLDENFTVAAYRNIANVLGIVDQFDADMEKLFQFDRENGRDTSWYHSDSNNGTNGTHRD